jgi:hypothetical protein
LKGQRAAPFANGERSDFFVVMQRQFAVLREGFRTEPEDFLKAFDEMAPNPAIAF